MQRSTVKKTDDGLLAPKVISCRCEMDLGVRQGAQYMSFVNHHAHLSNDLVAILVRKLAQVRNVVPFRNGN